MPRMQQLIAVVVILVSLGLGWYAWIVGQRTLKPQAPPPAGSAVVVAAQPLPAGQPIAADALRTETMTLRPEGAFDQPAAVVGKVPNEALAAGEPVLAKRLAGEAPAAFDLKRGERAVAVRIDEVSGVGNRLQPRDRVDAFVVLRRTPDEVGETQARLLLPDLPVLAVGGRGEGPAARPGGADVPRTAVLAVPQEEVSRLLVAAETGRLLLALRSPGEPGTATLTEAERPRWVANLSEESRATLRALAGGAPAKADAADSAAVARRPFAAIEVIRGSTEEQMK